MTIQPDDPDHPAQDHPTGHRSPVTTRDDDCHCPVALSALTGSWALLHQLDPLDHPLALSPRPRPTTEARGREGRSEIRPADLGGRRTKASLTRGDRVHCEAPNEGNHS